MEPVLQIFSVKLVSISVWGLNMQHHWILMMFLFNLPIYDSQHDSLSDKSSSSSSTYERLKNQAI